MLATIFLQGNGANVSEAGYKTGYASLSKFTLAYKKTFGILPKEAKSLTKRLK